MYKTLFDVMEAYIHIQIIPANAIKILKTYYMYEERTHKAGDKIIS